MSILDNISSPKDLKGLSYSDLDILADELRNKILDTVSNNGGHLASNLGIVETTIAIHRIFNSPEDQIVLDVGHQSYVHKLLTGRQREFDTLRQWEGLSGFTNRQESIYDPFGAGHSGTSISAALGLATANQLNGKQNYVIAVVGDGSFTNGMIYEALNNCTKNNLKLIIILNDNEMSISENVGGLSKYLSRIRTSEKYFSLKHKIQMFFHKIPLVGDHLVSTTRKLKKRIKKRVMNENLFENLGLDYLGPIEGGKIKKLETVLREAKDKNKCCLVHVHTVKGKGYKPAEDNPEIYHSVGAFDLKSGVDATKKSISFSSVFGDILCREAAHNQSICAITAAMTSGTGLNEFRENYPQRFYDVGIAEEHAVTFGAGLSANQKTPVCAIYSTFTQRVYDQLIHDVAIQKLPMIMALDRCGLVPGDGITHQGIYDCSYLASIPGIEIFSPETYAEMDQSFNHAFYHNGLVVIRYPKGMELEYNRSKYKSLGGLSYLDFSTAPYEVAIITYGRITKNAYDAIKLLNNAGHIRLIKLVKVYPLDFEKIFSLIEGVRVIYILEEGIKSGGIAEKLASEFAQNDMMHTKKILIRAIENPLMEQGDLASLYASCGFQPEQIAAEIKDLMKNN
ncbi:1-deoxy-D-xylulose-5-phosphate synthase [Acetobacterium paludosum]|uniref:1-deoxy-D-xylulose-5-phosphate synthase n=1 Tax=Acetobacterium paludosum TaxID=52693 RepID=A0A923KR99_9FIRM|nr:1-deoxy-D-xylulose-5-phosphate synthase [Acetobacterium paludosum]MBC3889939.1 1-deoxy-D-xylulose-5-phosphate synthase [Acetobacterium paludosum]